MSEQHELEFIGSQDSFHCDVSGFWDWSADEKIADQQSDVLRRFYGHHPSTPAPVVLHKFMAKFAATSQWLEQIEPTERVASLPVDAGNRLILENERLKTQLMVERRTAHLARRKENELFLQHASLIETTRDLAATQKVLTLCLAARADARVCFHEHYSGTVSEIMGEQIVVVYEVDDGEPMKQVYDRKQFVADHVPREGDELCAYVFIAQHPPGRVLLERSTTAMTEPDFSGFDKRVTGDVEI